MTDILAPPTAGPRRQTGASGIRGAFPATFWNAFATDFLVRTAYQMGKTPVLPLFAAAVGAGEMLVGLIVAVSTCTGMVTKPLIGVLSDRMGRRIWLLAALCLFAGMPFLYRFVETPEGLMALRLIHGTATAIMGPVTLAYIAEMDRMAQAGRATRLAWFGYAREGGYLVAPAVAGWMLTVMPPEEVFTIVGLVSLLAFIPFSFMQFASPDKSARREADGSVSGSSSVSAVALLKGLRHAASRGATWIAGALETAIYFVTYGLKAFLPLFAVGEGGFGILVAGLFFSVQEAAHLLTRPVGGWLGDRAGYKTAIASGMAVLAAAVALIPSAGTSGVMLMAAAVLSGVGQGLIFPSTVAMVGEAAGSQHMGAGMGIYGALRNSGKIAGPVVVGLLLSVAGFSAVFTSLAIALAVSALLLLSANRGPANRL